MPSEIRNTTYPKTAVDLLLPQPGAGGRGDSTDGFDNLLRALAPVERNEVSPLRSGSRSPSQASDRPTSSYDSSNSTYTQRTPDAPSSRDNRSEQSEQPQATSEESAQVSDEPEAESPSNPSTEVENAQGEGGETDVTEPVEAAGPSPKDETEDEEGEDVSPTVVDATAQQLAVAAAQTPVATTDTPLKVAEPTEGDVVAELQPASEVPATQEKPNHVVALPGAETPTTTTLEQPTTEAAATEPAPSQEQGQTPEIETAAPVVEAVEAVRVEQPVAGAEQAEGEQPVISDLRSMRTQTDGSIRHDTPPKQPGDAMEASPNHAEAELPPESIDAAAQPDTEIPVTRSEATTNSNSQRDDDRKSEPTATEKAEPVAEASFETATLEATAAELPPADNTPTGVAEPTRSEPASQQQQQHNQQLLVDTSARTGGAPRLAAEVLAGNTRDASQSRPVEIDSARFLTRVARAFTAAQQRGGEVQMRLSPPELGSLRVEIKVVEGVMTARVETENASAQTALLEHLPQLRERLAEQGVRIERFDVDLMQNGSSNTPDRPADRQADEGFSRRGNQGTNRTKSSASSEPRAAAATLSASGRLNVIV